MVKSKMDNSSIVLIGDDGYEGLYVGGKLVESGCPINQGFSRINFFKKLAKKYDFNLELMQEHYWGDEDNTITDDNGYFHSKLSDYKFEYYII